MADRGVRTDEPLSFPENGVGDGTVGLSAIEQRVRRLEDAVAVLQDTRQLEERVVGRVSDRMLQVPMPAVPVHVQESGNLLVRGSRKLLPSALALLAGPTVTVDPAEAGRTAAPTRPALLFFDMLAELRAMWRMFFDPRYRLSRLGRIMPLVLIVLIATSWYWVIGAWALWSLSQTLGALYVKAWDLLLAYFLFKFLTREARRYRETFPELDGGPRRMT